MTPSEIMLDVSTSTKTKIREKKRYNKHVILIRLGIYFILYSVLRIVASLYPIFLKVIWHDSQTRYCKMLVHITINQKKGGKG